MYELWRRLPWRAWQDFNYCSTFLWFAIEHCRERRQQLPTRDGGRSFCPARTPIRPDKTGLYDLFFVESQFREIYSDSTRAERARWCLIIISVRFDELITKNNIYRNWQIKSGLYSCIKLWITLCSLEDYRNCHRMSLKITLLKCKLMLQRAEQYR